MNRRERSQREGDFVALFNALWYRDFPVIPDFEELGRRAVWTTHIASVVKQCADLMGLFTCFESGGRTDAVIQTAAEGRTTWAKIEWEWLQPRSEKVNEFDKLADSVGDSELSIYIGYSRLEYHDENIQKIAAKWSGLEKPLLVFLVTYFYSANRRHFENLETHYFKNFNNKRLRIQSA